MILILQKSLISILGQLCCYGDIIIELESFVERIYTRHDDNIQSHTYQAFAASLSHFLKEYKCHLTELEKSIRIQGKMTKKSYPLCLVFSNLIWMAFVRNLDFLAINICKHESIPVGCYRPLANRRWFGGHH